MINSPLELKSNGQVLTQLTPDELKNKKQCARCQKEVLKVKPWKDRKPQVTNNPKTHDMSSDNATILSAPKLELDEGEQGDQDQAVQENKETKDSKPPKEPVMRCHYHPGRIYRGMYSCCDGHRVYSKGCTPAEHHEIKIYEDGELETKWRYFETPPTPQSRNWKQAVALDCEMGVSIEGDSELIKVSLVDYFTSAVLIDSLVLPNAQMRDYCTRYSGVAAADMDRARRAGSALRGREAARQAIWGFVGPETIVVGYGVSSDFNALRWIHESVFDPFLLEQAISKQEKTEKERAEKDNANVIPQASESNASGSQDLTSVPKLPASVQMLIPPSLSAKEVKENNADGPNPAKKNKEPKDPAMQLKLKARVKVRLGKDIQTKGKDGHDSLEDALAVRDLAHWFVVEHMSKAKGETNTDL